LEWINFSESGKSGHFLLDALLSFPYAVYYRERADYLPLCWLLPSQRWPVARRSSATDNVSYWWAGMPNETIADAKATLGIFDVVQLHLNEPGDSVGEPMKQQRGILARFLCLPSPEPTQKIS
jgi:hypothetical protein